MTTNVARLMTRLILFSVGAALLFVCPDSAAGRPRQGAKSVRARVGQEFTLRAGQRAELQGDGLRVRFASVAGDSRCPPGVTCVWAGNAEVLVEAEAGGRRASLKLNTHGGAEYPKEARHGRYVVALVALSPRPRTRPGGRTKPAEYAATLVIRKA